MSVVSSQWLAKAKGNRLGSGLTPCGDVNHPVPLLGGFHKQIVTHPSLKSPTLHLGDPQILTGVCDREATNVSGVNAAPHGHLPTSPARHLTITNFLT